MLQLPDSSTSHDKSAHVVTLSDLKLDTMYILTERYEGLHDNGGDLQPEPRVLDGATIRRLARDGTFHILRTYSVQPEEGGSAKMLVLFPERVKKALVPAKIIH